jgi:lactoylglutathione lyase
MPVLQSIAPQFQVANLEQSIAFYRDLGFEQVIDYEGFYASVSRGDAEIHLKHADRHAGAAEYIHSFDHIDAYISVDDLQSLHVEYQIAGVAFLRDLATHPWGASDFYVLDPDGYVLCFAAPTL